MTQQIKYKNARTALRAKKTRLQNRLVDATSDLEKFKDPNLSVHDNEELLARLATDNNGLQKKVAVYNNILISCTIQWMKWQVMRKDGQWMS